MRMACSLETFAMPSSLGYSVGVGYAADRALCVAGRIRRCCSKFEEGTQLGSIVVQVRCLGTHVCAAQPHLRSKLFLRDAITCDKITAALELH